MQIGYNSGFAPLFCVDTIIGDALVYIRGELERLYHFLPGDMNLLCRRVTQYLEMSNFFDEQGRTRVYDEAY